MTITFPLEITNIDCANINEQQKNTLRELLQKHKLLVIRKQNLTKEQQIEFTKIFGVPDTAWSKQDPEDPRIQQMSNKNDDHVYEWRQDKTSIIRLWHVDNSFMDDPVRYTMLHAKILPPEGGDTKFINTHLAYEDLDADTKALLDKLNAYHTFNFIAEKWKERKDLSMFDYPDITHPLVMRTGDGSKSLYFSKLAVSHIEGLPKKDSDKLLTTLYAHCKKEKYKYRHQWQDGDLLIWDNAATMHKATFCDPKYLREHNRTNIRFSQAYQSLAPKLSAKL